MNGRHVTAHFAGMYLGFIGAPTAPSVDTIRHWVHRGRVRRVGTDEWGYALYDLTTVVTEATRLGYLNAATHAHENGDDPCL